MNQWVLSILAVIALSPLIGRAEDSALPNPNTAPHRTDSTNPQLPWYHLKPGEFPPIGSEHCVRGTLVEADYIHRCGQFRSEGTGELVNFAMKPYSVVYYLEAEADLRDVPLGTRLQFSVYQDDGGVFTKAVVIQDDYTLTARQGLVYRLDEVKAGTEKKGSTKLAVTRQKRGEKATDHAREEWIVDAQTPVWKNDQRIKLSELAEADELLANFSAGTGQNENHVTEIWVGSQTQKDATERQRKKHVAFVKQRGLPAGIDCVEGKKLVVTVFGDPAGLAALCKDEAIVPDHWAKHQVRVAVANEELRTYNPPVDNKGAEVLEFHHVATDCYGSSGVQWTIEPSLLLEGFRKGRIVRLFAHYSWPIEDMPFGETLYTERPGAKMEEEAPNQYSYRTDFSNDSLPWYQLRPSEFPPYQSQHIVSGELLKVDAIHRSGQFRPDGNGALVDFTMPPFGFIRYLNADAELAELPLGTRYLFYLYQDEKGSFTKAVVLIDEFTWLTSETLTGRVEALRPDEGKIVLASQLAPLKDEKDHLVRPPDLSHAEWGVDDKTRVWKGDKQVNLADLVVGDELLMNLTGSTETSRSLCTEIWDGHDTHKLATERQRARHSAFLKQHGMPGWIETVDGKTLTIQFFAGNRREFQDVKQGEPWGKGVAVRLSDDDLRPVDDHVENFQLKENLPEQHTAGTYGSAGVRWVLEANQLPKGYTQGRIVRVFKPDWEGKLNGN